MKRDSVIFIILVVAILLTYATPQESVTKESITGMATSSNSGPEISSVVIEDEIIIGKKTTVTAVVTDEDGVDFVLFNIYGETFFMTHGDRGYYFSFTPRAVGTEPFKIIAYDKKDNANSYSNTIQVLPAPSLDTDEDGLPDDIDSCPGVYALTPDGCPEKLFVIDINAAAIMVIIVLGFFFFFRYNYEIFDFFKNLRKKKRPEITPPPIEIGKPGVVVEEAGAKPPPKSLLLDKRIGPVTEVEKIPTPVEPKTYEYKRTSSTPTIRYRPKMMRIERPKIYIVAPEKKPEKIEKEGKKPKPMEMPPLLTTNRIKRNLIGREVVLQGKVKFVKTFLSGDHGYIITDKHGKLLATSESLIKDTDKPVLIYGIIEEAGGSLFIRITKIKR